MLFSLARFVQFHHFFLGRSHNVCIRTAHGVCYRLKVSFKDVVKLLLTYI